MEYWRFRNDLSETTPLLEGSHDPILVMLSIVLASFAGITALALADRMTASPDKKSKAWWHAGGAVSLACGIWAMHFTGMLAFSLPDIKMSYSAATTLVSLVPAIVGSTAALWFIARIENSSMRLHACALLLAAGIGTMHYTGMEAMEMPGLRYDLTLFVLSLVVAYILAITALGIRVRLRRLKTMPENVINYISGCVIGISIAGMHYTAMAAAEFHAVPLAHEHSASLSDTALAITITLFAGLILGLSILATWIDRQIGFQRLLHLERMAHTDALTGLPNRVMYESQLDVAVEEYHRTGDRFALLYFDLNRFKPVNDTYGHAVGDLVLREFAARIKSTLREDDLAARIGGDEFVVILRDLQHPEDAAQAAERIQEALASPVRLSSLQLPLSASIGISLCPQDGTNANVLMQQADEAMYRAKTGNLGYCFAAQALNHPIGAGLIGDTIREALEQSELILLYQPWVDLETRDFIGLEVFARWPPDQSLPAEEFIALAESRGLTKELSDLVLRGACKQAREWLDKGVHFGKLAINISDAQLNHGSFSKSLKAILQQFDIPAELLELEIRPSCLRPGNEFVRNELLRIRELGITIALDDVDASTSLELLTDAPIQKVKISRELISKAPYSSKVIAQIRTIVTLCQEVGYEIACSGVETEEQCQLLSAKGAKVAQGYLFYKPASADVIASRLAKEKTSLDRE